MKLLSASVLVLCAAVLYAPCIAEAQASGGEVFRQEGIASWYGTEFDGRPTASGEIFNSSLFTAAHPTLPFGTVLLVTNRHNNRQVSVTVNDRGPFVAARIIDVSKAAAEQLDMMVTGTAPVVIESINRPTVAGRNSAPQPQPVAPPPQPVAPAPSPPVQPSVVQLVQVNPAPPPPATVQPSAAANAPMPELPMPEYRQPKAPSAALIPPITPAPDKTYKLQVGSYKNPRNAVAACEKLIGAGLSPSYELYGELYRVVLAGIRGTEVPKIAEKLGAEGFREALLREDKKN